jgi:citrate synthase
VKEELTMTTVQTHLGLEGVVAATTRISGVDGQAGELILAGFPVEALAAQATFEEVTYLLWHDALPDAAQLSDFTQRMAAYRTLPAVTLDVLQAAAEKQISVMDALRMAVGTLGMGVGEDKTDAEQEALMLVARFPLIVAAYWRLRNGKAPLAPPA